jgi:DNA-binding transcriptional LysR family regulator
LRGQGVALSSPIYLAPELQSGRLVRLGCTPLTFGDYWLLETTDRASAKARAAFAEWLDAEIQPMLRATPPASSRPPGRGR